VRVAGASTANARTSASASEVSAARSAATTRSIGRTRSLTRRIYCDIYIGMTERAKIFQNGGSQAVRLPKSFRFPDDQGEVIVRREGRRVVLEPVDAWSREFLDCLGQWDEEIERPDSAQLESLRDPFSTR
jgi:antitoxin VapB